jgi:hypothetical protein
MADFSSAPRKCRRSLGPVRGLVVLFLLAASAPPATAADIELDPIRYSRSPADNPVSRLQQRLDSGRVRLEHEPAFGYLRSLLRELRVPESSQMLVFSKTSFQRQRISPKSPRAIYFGDDAYVGYCRHGDVIEVAAVDPQLGAVFYTLPQEPSDRPRFGRQTDACLICHSSLSNQGFPGHVVRSVYSDEGGYPILSMGTYRTDHDSPLAKRWGGWYVTGTSGRQGHLGNLILKEEQPPEKIDNTAGRNVTTLAGRFNPSGYLSGHSDIVALLVFEHQTEMHNRIARASFLTRLALHEEADINKALGRPADYRSESTTRRIAGACEPLVRYLLFSGEARLTEKVAGTSGFAREFAAAGPRDGRGRSLRELDLERRLFRYPCSYLVYSAAFDALPVAAKDRVLRRVWEVLSGKDTSAEFAHLSGDDRRAILEILIATKPGLPEYWRLPAAAGSR